MKVSEESYRTYPDTQVEVISYVGSEDDMFYMDYFMEGMDEYLIDKLEICDGDVSLLKDQSNRYIALITNKDEDGNYFIDENTPKIGDKITIADATAVEFIDTRTGAPATDSTYERPEFLAGTYSGLSEYEYTVCAYVDVPNDISLRKASLGYNVIASSDNLKKDFGEIVVLVFYAFDTESHEAEEKAESYLHRFSEEDSSITYESKAVKRSEF